MYIYLYIYIFIYIYIYPFLFFFFWMKSWVEWYCFCDSKSSSDYLSITLTFVFDSWFWICEFTLSGQQFCRDTVLDGSRSHSSNGRRTVRRESRRLVIRNYLHWTRFVLNLIFYNVFFFSFSLLTGTDSFILVLIKVDSLLQLLW